MRKNTVPVPPDEPAVIGRDQRASNGYVGAPGRTAKANALSARAATHLCSIKRSIRELVVMSKTAVAFPSQDTAVLGQYRPADDSYAVKRDSVAKSIAHLRATATQLVVAKKAIDELMTLREMKTDDNCPAEYLQTLARIEVQLSQLQEPTYAPKLLQELSEVRDHINMGAARLTFQFSRLRHLAESTEQSAHIMLNQITYRDSKDEGERRVQIIVSIMTRLRLIQPVTSAVDVLSRDSLLVLSAMVEIERQRAKLLELVRKDAKRQFRTAIYVTIAIIAFVLVGISLVILIPDRLSGDTSFLDQMSLPLIHIPWPILVWSLIGSLSAMLYTFNRRPSQDFGETVKWLFTRPVQGMALGAALYLVLVSGMMLLTGKTVSQVPNQNISRDVVLVLSFLVGFSDRFADGVFRTLVDTYTSLSRRHEVPPHSQL